MRLHMAIFGLPALLGILFALALLSLQGRGQCSKSQAFCNDWKCIHPSNDWVRKE